MRSLLSAAVALTLVGAEAGRCEADEQEARSIVEKAIKATGGAEKLSEYKAAAWTEKGMYYGMGEGLPYTGKYAMQYPDKFRMEILDVFTTVLDGDKGWLQMNGQTQELSAEDLAEMKEQTFAGWVTTLLPLKDPQFKLDMAGEATINGQPAAGVKVSSKGHRDVILHFDTENHLLVRSETKVKSDEMGGREVVEEVTYSDYRNVDGMKHPFKAHIKRDGQRYVESEVTEIKNARSLPAETFAKP